MATPRRPRKPAKPKPSTIARRGKRDPLTGSEWVNVSENVKKKINNAARSAAVAIMNGLAEKGPAYSGDFRDSWRASALGGFAANQPSPKGHPYRIQDVPQLKTTVKAQQKVTVFEIVNTAPYALYAMDILPGKLFKNGAEYESATISVIFTGVNSSLGSVNGDSAVNPLEGVIYEVVSLARRASTTERQLIEGYLAHKWGLTANLPNDHPYKVNPPAP